MFLLVSIRNLKAFKQNSHIFFLHIVYILFIFELMQRFLDFDLVTNVKFD